MSMLHLDTGISICLLIPCALCHIYTELQAGTLMHYAITQYVMLLRAFFGLTQCLFSLIYEANSYSHENLFPEAISLSFQSDFTFSLPPVCTVCILFIHYLLLPYCEERFPHLLHSRVYFFVWCTVGSHLQFLKHMND